MHPDTVLEVVESYILSGVLEIVRVDVGCYEGPWPLGAAEQGIDAACASANVEADELTPWFTVGGRVEKRLEP